MSEGRNLGAILEDKVNAPEIKEIFHEGNVIHYEDKTIKVLRFIFRDLYVARHLGKYGEMIDVPKIRTMCLNAESKLKEVVEINGFGEDDKPVDDPRIIQSRRWLRKFFLDELPQIPYNLILKRNMKIVGIRSKDAEYWENYPKKHMERVLKSSDYAAFLGVHRYNPKRTAIQNERRYLAEKKLSNKKYSNKIIEKMNYHLSSSLIDTKYSLVIMYNVLSGRTKGG